MHLLPLTAILYLVAFCLAHDPSSSLVDVAIIGAGLSGLSTAKDLANAGKSFVILEARERVGGRVLNINLPNGGVTEAGAEFVGPTQDRVLLLAEELGLQTYATYTAGKNILYRNGTASPFSGDLASGGLPPLQPTALLQLGSAESKLDSLAQEIDVNAPWNHTNAAEWDSITFKEWVDKEAPHPDAKFLLGLASTSVLSTETREPSLLYTLAYIAAAGNETTKGTLERLTGVQNAAQEKRIVGGTQLLAIQLAQRLGLENIIFNAPVRRIKQIGDQYVVVADGDRIFSARHVVVAMSPPIASRIVYDPPLPAQRDQLTQRMPMGSLGKAIAVYETPFWRTKGLNGQVLSDSGLVRSTFDNSPENGSYGAIMGFIEADEARRADLLSEKEIQDEVTKDYVNYFGTEAANVSSWVIQRWDLEEFSRGGPVAFAPTGVISQYGVALKQAVGKIHFAGTETSPYWTGYMDGAIRSGERVAAEILRSL